VLVGVRARRAASAPVTGTAAKYARCTVPRGGGREGGPPGAGRRAPAPAHWRRGRRARPL